MATIPPMTSSSEYFAEYCKIFLKVQMVRAAHLFGVYTARWRGTLPSVDIRPFESILIPSTKSSRRIRVNAYRTKAAMARDGGPVAVHLTWHGSGYVLYSFGESIPFVAHLISHSTLEDYPLVVLDCDYAKAPEYPCPAATDDARDVLEYVFARPEMFDLTKVTMGGFSAGGNISLGLSAALGKEAHEGKLASGGAPSRGRDHPIKTVIAFYPVTEWDSRPDFIPPPGVVAPGVTIRKEMIGIFDSSYFFPPGPLSQEEAAKRKEQQTRTPLYTPRWAEPRYFPESIGLITCEYDPLTAGAEGLRADLMKDGNGKSVYGWMVKGVQHAWDTLVLPGQPGYEEKQKAYDLAARMIAKAGGITGTD